MVSVVNNTKTENRNVHIGSANFHSGWKKVKNIQNEGNHNQGESPETMWKLCLSTKFPHQEIRWNYSILRSSSYCIIYTAKKLNFLTFCGKLTHFVLLVYFYSPWKHQKTKNLLMLPGGLERDQWHEMDKHRILGKRTNVSVKHIWFWLKNCCVYWSWQMSNTS